MFLIDPKDYRLCRLERNILRAALKSYIKDQDRRAARLKNPERIDAAIDNSCLAADLLAKIGKA